MSKFSRRNFLKMSSAVGGGLALGPSLQSLAFAEGAASTKFIVVSLGHSLDPGSDYGSRGWVPTTNSNGTIGRFPTHMAPLEAFKDKMVAVSGVRNLVAKMVRSNGHDSSSRTLLNCMPHKEFSGYGSTLDSKSSGGGPSIEYYLANKLNQIPLILRSGTSNVGHRRSFLMDGSDDLGSPDPVASFENLFAASVPSGSGSSADRIRARRGEILNAARQSYDDLAQRVGSDDRERLQLHSSLIDNFIRETNANAASAGGSCSNISQEYPSGYKSNWDREGSGRDDDVISRMHNSLMATAFGCGVTKVASLHYTNMQSNQFSFLNGGDDLIAETGSNWHGICHHESGSNELRVRVQTWYSEMLVDLLQKLDNTPDVSGSVLDNTIVVFTTSLGNRAHGTNDMPFIFFGGANTGLKTNQYIDLTSTERRPINDVWTTVLQLMGQSDEAFGMTGVFQGSGQYEGHPFNNGPISEVMI